MASARGNAGYRKADPPGEEDRPSEKAGETPESRPVWSSYGTLPKFAPAPARGGPGKGRPG